MIEFFMRIIAWFVAQHVKHTAFNIYYCRNPLCMCFNSKQKKRYYVLPPKCPKCNKRMKK